MRLSFCAACGSTDEASLEYHYLVPRSQGGGDEEENLLTLCPSCRGKAHTSRMVATRSRRGEKALDCARQIARIIADIEKEGVTTLTGIAKALEARGVKTPRGHDNWTPVQVARIKERAACA